MFKKIFKNMSQESTENIEKENINEENVSENQGIPTPEITVEEQLKEDDAFWKSNPLFKDAGGNQSIYYLSLRR
jgi:hypothetical protein